jgi:hypothetical protein
MIEIIIVILNHINGTIEVNLLSYSCNCNKVFGRVVKRVALEDFGLQI